MTIPTSTNINAQPLTMLAARFEANCKALAARNLALAERLRQCRPVREHLIGLQNGQLLLIRREADTAAVVPDPVPPPTEGACDVTPGSGTAVFLRGTVLGRRREDTGQH